MAKVNFANFHAWLNLWQFFSLHQNKTLCSLAFALSYKFTKPKFPGERVITFLFCLLLPIASFFSLYRLLKYYLGLNWTWKVYFHCLCIIIYIILHGKSKLNILLKNSWVKRSLQSSRENICCWTFWLTVSSLTSFSSANGWKGVAFVESHFKVQIY